MLIVIATLFHLNDSTHLITFFIMTFFAYLANAVCTVSYMYWPIYFNRNLLFIVRNSPYPVQILENMDQKKTPYLDTFHAVLVTIWKSFVRPQLDYNITKYNVALAVTGAIGNSFEGKQYQELGLQTLQERL